VKYLCNYITPNLLLTVWPLCYKEVYILGSELPFLLFDLCYSILGTILIHLNSYIQHAYTAKIKDLLFDKCISHRNTVHMEYIATGTTEYATMA